MNAGKNKIDPSLSAFISVHQRFDFFKFFDFYA